jgi:hypothetical protein
VTVSGRLADDTTSMTASDLSNGVSRTIRLSAEVPRPITRLRI